MAVISSWVASSTLVAKGFFLKDGAASVVVVVVVEGVVASEIREVATVAVVVGRGDTSRKPIESNGES